MINLIDCYLYCWYPTCNSVHVESTNQYDNVKIVLYLRDIILFEMPRIFQILRFCSAGETLPTGKH